VPYWCLPIVRRTPGAAAHPNDIGLSGGFHATRQRDGGRAGHTADCRFRLEAAFLATRPQSAATHARRHGRRLPKADPSPADECIHLAGASTARDPFDDEAIADLRVMSPTSYPKAAMVRVYVRGLPPT
jgi:hypothetical protein